MEQISKLTKNYVEISSFRKTDDPSSHQILRDNQCEYLKSEFHSKISAFFQRLTLRRHVKQLFSI